MSAQRFVKKPAEVEAMQWDGKDRATAEPIIKWVNDNGGCAYWREEVSIWIPDGIGIGASVGQKRADPGDWIVRDQSGEFHACQPDVFAATYEPVAAPVPVEAVAVPSVEDTNQ